MLKDDQRDRIRRMFMLSQQIRSSKGQIVLGNDSEPNGVYFISEGYVKVYSLHDEGDEYLHLIFGEGEIFPIMWAYMGVQPLSLFYETMSDTVLFRISRDRFSDLIGNNLFMANAMSQQLARQCLIYIDRIDNLEYKKARERLLYRLIFLANRFGEVQGKDIVIKAPITHETLANSINLSRESVSRQMESLYRNNVLARKHGHIRILNLQSLIDGLSRPANIENWDLPKNMLNSHTGSMLT